LEGGTNLFSYVAGNPTTLIDPKGLSYLIFNRSTHTITLYYKDGRVVGEYPAYNNTISDSMAWPIGTYDYSHYNFHLESGPNDSYGSLGIFVFNVLNRSGMGVHSGQEDKDCGGPPCKTKGCIRTTEEAMSAILHTHFGDTWFGGDKLTTIRVNP
jgi:hypothetical protein